MPIQDLVTQGIRTAAQALAAVLIAWLLKQGVDIDSNSVENVLVALLTAVYAVLTSVLSNWKPAFGYLSIIPKKPSYSTPPGPAE